MRRAILATLRHSLSFRSNVVNPSPLTYMSIDVAIGTLITKAELEFVPHMMPGVPVVRDVFASPEVMQLIGDGGGLDEELERVGGRARAKIDNFTAGKPFVFGMQPHNKSVTCTIARNDPIHHGVLDVRVTDPTPAVRIFGFCVKCDALVLLTWRVDAACSFPSK